MLRALESMALNTYLVAGQQLQRDGGAFSDCLENIDFFLAAKHDELVWFEGKHHVCENEPCQVQLLGQQSGSWVEVRAMRMWGSSEDVGRGTESGGRAKRTWGTERGGINQWGHAAFSHDCCAMVHNTHTHHEGMSFAVQGITL